MAALKFHKEDRRICRQDALSESSLSQRNPAWFLVHDRNLNLKKILFEGIVRTELQNNEIVPVS